ncbi:MAG: hypothetical protein ABIJ57_16715, partial [Pseudomonadota bacterium]
AAITGHTADDQWVIGNLNDEPTSVSGSTAQIIDTTARLLNPNATLTWTTANTVSLQIVNFTNGKATFSGAPGVTTLDGNNGYIPASALQKVAYLIDWSQSVTLDMADTSRMGQQWKEAIPGQAGGTGSANAYFIGGQPLYDALYEAITAGDKYFLLQLYTWDQSQNQTGDHINAWVTFTSFNLGTTISDVVKETVNWQVVGPVSFG